MEKIDRLFAPIDNYSDLPFRLLCQKYGADACCVPLVGAIPIAREKKVWKVDAHPDEKNIGVQIVGNEPESIGNAVKIIDEDKPFVAWYNLNCGCPSIRTQDSGGGSAMLDYPERIALAVSAMRKVTDKPISVKMRLKKDVHTTIDIGTKIEVAGADFIVIHGRTAEQGYSGHADWEAIKGIHNALGITVIGNGDVVNDDAGRKLVTGGYCNGYMIGRAAMANPMAFSNKTPDGIPGKVAILQEYLQLAERYLIEIRLNDVKIKATQIFSGIENARALRNVICRANSVEEIKNYINQICACNLW